MRKEALKKGLEPLAHHLQPVDAVKTEKDVVDLFEVAPFGQEVEVQEKFFTQALEGLRYRKTPAGQQEFVRQVNKRLRDEGKDTLDVLAKAYVEEVGAENAVAANDIPDALNDLERRLVVQTEAIESLSDNAIADLEDEMGKHGVDIRRGAEIAKQILGPYPGTSTSVPTEEDANAAVLDLARDLPADDGGSLYAKALREMTEGDDQPETVREFMRLPEFRQFVMEAHELTDPDQVTTQDLRRGLRQLMYWDKQDPHREVGRAYFRRDTHPSPKTSPEPAAATVDDLAPAEETDPATLSASASEFESIPLDEFNSSGNPLWARIRAARRRFDSYPQQGRRSVGAWYDLKGVSRPRV